MTSLHVYVSNSPSTEEDGREILYTDSSIIIYNKSWNTLNIPVFLRWLISEFPDRVFVFHINPNTNIEVQNLLSKRGLVSL